MKKILPLLFSLIGIADSGYLTYEHYAKLIVPCSTGYFVDCGKVLESPYATPFGIPLALIGLIHYSIFFIVALLLLQHNNVWLRRLMFAISAAGAIASILFVYLQIWVIGAICLYCMVSALNSFAAFIMLRIFFRNEYRSWLIWLSALFYKTILKNIFFCFPPEFIHTTMVHNGEFLGRIPFIKKSISRILAQKNKNLLQEIHGISFTSPIGLAAGFDYEARLTQILPALGFGFQTVGTITHKSYDGNPSPILGRLPKSKSLMVNKGFKNKGAQAVVGKLHNLSFDIPVGISIGQTNGLKTNSLEEVIQDIVGSFNIFEKSNTKNSFYELNISCPNLSSTVSFYPPKNLEKLLKAVDGLHLKKPLFIKMPIEKSDNEFSQLLDVIVKHSIAGIIVGNLQKDRQDTAFDKNEVSSWKHGGFSGKPTEKRSNELISLAYKKYSKKIVIIGCGGVFSAEDAYEKIKRGASLVQLITGMVFIGPQLIAQINDELVLLLKNDGYSNISQAVGCLHD